MITDFLLPGAIIGLAAGLSPGPLLTLVISETLMYSRSNGIQVALAPLISDIPILLVTYFLFDQLRDMSTILGAITMLGGIFLAYLGYVNLRVNESKFQANGGSSHSLRKAMIVNLLSPHPYIFWFSVGGSYMVKGDLMDCGSFLAGFYLLLVGSKVTVALVTHKGKSILQSRYFVFLIRGLGCVLLGFSFLLIRSGIAYLRH